MLGFRGLGSVWACWLMVYVFFCWGLGVWGSNGLWHCIYDLGVSENSGYLILGSL